MAIIFKDLFKLYGLTSEDVKPLLSMKYNIDYIYDNLVLEDEQVNYLIDSIYGKIDNDVDIYYEENVEPEDSWDDGFDDEDDLFESDEEYDEEPDCPPKSDLPYTHGRLTCPYCGQMGDTYADGTAYCPKCRKWYRYA